MNELFGGILTISIAALISNIAARVLVELADLLGLEWNEGRERKRHAADAHEPPPAPSRSTSGPYRVNLADPRIRKAIREAETVHATPLANAVRRARARRLVEVTGGR